MDDWREFLRRPEDEDAAERLRAYVARGGNVMWICGDNVEPVPYNQANQQAQEDTAAEIDPFLVFHIVPLSF